MHVSSSSSSSLPFCPFFSSSLELNNMSLKNAKHFFMIIVFLFCFFILLDGWRREEIQSSRFSKLKTGNMLQGSYSYTNRKVLEASKFDFTPFLRNHYRYRYRHRHHHQQHRRHIAVELEPPDDDDDQGEFDPIFGTEKRLVPSGPNPLHH